MNANETRLAEEVIRPEVATEIAGVHGDDVVYAAEVVVEAESSRCSFFRGWQGPVLLLSQENEGVCSWGLSLDGHSAGAVVVGGDLCGGERTIVYASDLAAFVVA